MLPYYVPNFAHDENVSKASKTRSVCFYGTATNPTRRLALEALRAVPGAMLQLGSKAPGIGASESERESERPSPACKCSPRRPPSSPQVSASRSADGHRRLAARCASASSASYLPGSQVSALDCLVIAS